LLFILNLNLNIKILKIKIFLYLLIFNFIKKAIQVLIKQEVILIYQMESIKISIFKEVVVIII